MRFQEKIYNRSGNFLRNRDNYNVSMSSDICVFNSPLFNVSGATKIEYNFSNGGYFVISDETEIEFGFTFSDTESLNDNSTFNFEIYKYNFDTLVFETPNIYKSEDYPNYIY